MGIVLIFKLGFHSTWELLDVKLDLEKAEEPEIKCQMLLDSRKSKRILEKHLLVFHWIHKSLGCVDQNKLWKILNEMRIPDHLICFLKNLQADQQAIVRTGNGTMNWFQIGKGLHQDCILSPLLFNLYTEYIMRGVGAGWSSSRNQDYWEKYE